MTTLSPTEITVTQINLVGIKTHETRVIENEKTGKQETWMRELKFPMLKLDIHISFVCDGAHPGDTFRCKKGNMYFVVKTHNEGDKCICFAKNVSSEFDSFEMPKKLFYTGQYSPQYRKIAGQ